MLERFRALQFPVQLVITLVFMAAILGASFHYVISPKNEEVKSQRSRLDELNAEIQKGINLEKKLPELEREIANLEAQLTELKSIMPPQRIDSEIVSRLESVAKRSRLAIRQLVPQRTRAKDFYDEYPIAIDVSANYHDLAKFFDRVAHLPRIYNITGVTLRQFKGASAGTVAPYSLDASFTAVTFIYREQATPAAGPAKPAKPATP